VLVSAVGFAIYFLLGQIQGGWGTVMQHVQQPVFFDWGTNGGTGPDFTYILTHEYTVWAAIIASTFVTMATHGIDQDTVQRMLTAKNKNQSAVATILSGIVDVPIVSAFVLIGLLLHVYYQQHPDPTLPEATREIFPHFILHVMPAGLRGLVAAGILATAMGSLSTALNALATSFARDFILPKMGEEVAESERMKVLRWSTVGFATAIIIVGIITAWYVTWHPEARIIPLVLGILGYTFGSVLGIFLVALFTKTRGSDVGNVIAMGCGILCVMIMSVPELQKALKLDFILAFPWRIALGTLVTAAIAICFKTDTSLRSKSLTL
jgi:solute:Na+ symporter, SSS family